MASAGIARFHRLMRTMWPTRLRCFTKSGAALRIVTIFGGTGFLGRHIIQRLAKENVAIRVASRRPELAGFLRQCGRVGQIVPIQANGRNEASIARAVAGSDVVINLLGILYERGPQSFAEIHVEAPRRIAREAAKTGATRMIHVSALGADPTSPADYARSKAVGESAVLEAFPAATIFRPSIVFGPEDGFFNRFAALLRLVPVQPLFFERMPRFEMDGIFLEPKFEAGMTRYQPVYVGDVAAAVQAALAEPETGAKIYELGGPAVYSFADLMALIAEVTRRRALTVPVPYFVAALASRILQFAPIPPLTPDQVRLLKIDNVLTGDAPGLAELGVTPTAAELVLPTYLHRYRRGRMDSSPAVQA